MVRTDKRCMRKGQPPVQMDDLLVPKSVVEVDPDISSTSPCLRADKCRFQ